MEWKVSISNVILLCAMLRRSMSWSEQERGHRWKKNKFKEPIYLKVRVAPEKQHHACSVSHLGMIIRWLWQYFLECAIWEGGRAGTVILVSSLRLLIKSRAAGAHGTTAERSAAFQGTVLNYLLIFLPSKQKGLFERKGLKIDAQQLVLPVSSCDISLHVGSAWRSQLH